MSVLVACLPYVFTALASYLIGSISFAIVFTKIFSHTDIREHGSGNAGATNVLRTAGTVPAILTFIFDMLKAVAAISVAWLIFRYFSSITLDKSLTGYLFAVNEHDLTHYLIKYLAGLACFVGHIFPVYFSFHGGKGVLVTAGIMLIIDWRVFLIGISIFVIMVAVTKIVSVSSMTAAASLPISTLV
ncbi:MAG: glycerol-3-phosphate acyltransferase, partial [Clostridia bacterium]|nr:glycerol-3-phosphate acyltransferase [Clostridia bacterium]